MNRRQFGHSMAAGVGTALLGPLLGGAASSNRRGSPNVLLIGADDLRAPIIGCLGDRVAKTPNIDRLAARGVLFERAYCQQTLCNPSRSSVLTGMRPDTTRVWDNRTHFRDTVPGAVTLPEWFRRRGYFTQGIGKVYHAGLTRIQGDPQSWSVPATYHWGNHFKNPAEVPEGSAPSDPVLIGTNEIRDVPDEAYRDGRIRRSAVEALRKLSRGNEPFLLAAGFWKPHRPFNSPKRYWDLYDPAEIPPPQPAEPPAGAPEIAIQPQLLDYVAEVKRDPRVMTELRRGYYANVSFFDAQVGALVDEVDRLGLAENTIIVLWADHGYQQGEHAMWGKTSCFELDAHVPLIVVPPGGRAGGRRVPEIVESLDLYPTLLELAGLPSNDAAEGRSLVPLIEGHGTGGGTVRCACSQHPRPSPELARVESTQAKPWQAMGYSVRTDAWRYTEWRSWTTGEVMARELYDHRTDPGETRNAAGDPSQGAAVRECGELLAARVGRGVPRTDPEK